MNPNTAKVKGRETETRFVEYLRSHGLTYVERRRLQGCDDEGDIAGWPGMCVEIKSGARLDMAGWLDELTVEIDNANASMGFLAVRPKGKPSPEQWFAALPMPLLMILLAQAGWVPNDEVEAA